MGSDLPGESHRVSSKDNFQHDRTVGDCLAMALEMKAIAERCEDPRFRDQFVRFGAEWERRAARLLAGCLER
jgi:hypothetical protein